MELRTNQIRVSKVELSDNKGQSRRNTQKLFVGNIADGTTDDELRWLHQIHCILHEKTSGITVFQNRALFERYGRVVEADVMTDKNFGFVHVDASMGNLADYKQNIETWQNLNNLGRGKINEILRELHGAELNGNKLRVQLSTSGGGDGGFK